MFYEDNNTAKLLDMEDVIVTALLKAATTRSRY